jgi:hypothetical protein
VKADDIQRHEQAEAHEQRSHNSSAGENKNIAQPHLRDLGADLDRVTP